MDGVGSPTQNDSPFIHQQVLCRSAQMIASARWKTQSSRSQPVLLGGYRVFKTNSVIALYDTHDQAEDAVRDLQEAGVSMQSLSIAARGEQVEEHVVGYYTTGDRMKYWGKMGAFWGGLWGLLFDSALFAIPGIGPVLLAGPIVSWVVAILEGAAIVGGLSAIGAGLVSIGIPNSSVIEYESALKTDKFLLVVHGTPGAVARAKAVISTTRFKSCCLHDEATALESHSESLARSTVGAA